MSTFWQKLKKPFVCLAPLAGISDSPFRQICKAFGVDVVFTEMISAKGLSYQNENTLDLLRFSQKERPIILQLFGKEPETFAKAVRFIQKLPQNKRPDGLDLNLGCPARKVKAHGSGAILVSKPRLVNQIIKAISLNTDLPLSIKIRAGIKKEKITAINFIQKIDCQKIEAVSIHGRTLEQEFSGPVDYEQIRKIKEILKDKIIIANGGITDLKSARIMLNKTKADGIMIGQGSYGNPWIFKNIKRKEDEKPRLEEKIKIALEHSKLMVKYKGEEKGIREMRKHLLWYFRSLPDARKLRSKLVGVKTLQDVQHVLRTLALN